MAVDALVRENLTFRRLALGRDRPGASRGLQTLRSPINVFEEERSKQGGMAAAMPTIWSERSLWRRR